jgi:hypothetical protein
MTSGLTDPNLPVLYFSVGITGTEDAEQEDVDC